MSKAIKQMEMDALKQRFQGVREYVFLTVNKLDALAANPKLLNRPVVVTPRGVKACRPSETVLELL